MSISKLTPRCVHAQLNKVKKSKPHLSIKEALQQAYDFCASENDFIKITARQYGLNREIAVKLAELGEIESYVYKDSAAQPAPAGGFNRVEPMLPIAEAATDGKTESSNVKKIGYFNNTLEVEFHSGGRYVYFVGPEFYDEMAESPSKGEYLWESLRGKSPGLVYPAGPNKTAGGVGSSDPAHKMYQKVGGPANSSEARLPKELKEGQTLQQAQLRLLKIKELQHQGKVLTEIKEEIGAIAEKEKLTPKERLLKELKTLTPKERILRKAEKLKAEKRKKKTGLPVKEKEKEEIVSVTPEERAKAKEELKKIGEHQKKKEHSEKFQEALKAFKPHPKKAPKKAPKKPPISTEVKKAPKKPPKKPEGKKAEFDLPKEEKKEKARRLTAKEKAIQKEIEETGVDRERAEKIVKARKAPKKPPKKPSIGKQVAKEEKEKKKKGLSIGKQVAKEMKKTQKKKSKLSAAQVAQKKEGVEEEGVSEKEGLLRKIKSLMVKLKSLEGSQREGILTQVAKLRKRIKKMGRMDFVDFLLACDDEDRDSIYSITKKEVNDFYESLVVLSDMNEDKLREIIKQVEKEIEEKGITDEFERETYYRSRMMPLNLHLMEIPNFKDFTNDSKENGRWITLNADKKNPDTKGTPLFVKDGQTIGQAISKRFGKKKPKKSSGKEAKARLKARQGGLATKQREKRMLAEKAKRTTSAKERSKKALREKIKTSKAKEWKLTDKTKSKKALREKIDKVQAEKKKPTEIKRLQETISKLMKSKPITEGGIKKKEQRLKRLNEEHRKLRKELKTKQTKIPVKQLGTGKPLEKKTIKKTTQKKITDKPKELSLEQKTQKLTSNLAKMKENIKVMYTENDPKKRKKLALEINEAIKKIDEIMGNRTFPFILPRGKGAVGPRKKQGAPKKKRDFACSLDELDICPDKFRALHDFYHAENEELRETYSNVLIRNDLDPLSDGTHEATGVVTQAGPMLYHDDDGNEIVLWKDWDNILETSKEQPMLPLYGSRYFGSHDERDHQLIGYLDNWVPDNETERMTATTHYFKPLEELSDLDDLSRLNISLSYFDDATSGNVQHITKYRSAAVSLNNWEEDRCSSVPGWGSCYVGVKNDLSPKPIRRKDWSSCSLEKPRKIIKHRGQIMPKKIDEIIDEVIKDFSEKLKITDDLSIATGNEVQGLTLKDEFIRTIIQDGASPAAAESAWTKFKNMGRKEGAPIEKNTGGFVKKAATLDDFNEQFASIQKTMETQAVLLNKYEDFFKADLAKKEIELKAIYKLPFNEENQKIIDDMAYEDLVKFKPVFDAMIKEHPEIMPVLESASTIQDMNTSSILGMLGKSKADMRQAEDKLTAIKSDAKKRMDMKWAKKDG